MANDRGAQAEAAALAGRRSSEDARNEPRSAHGGSRRRQRPEPERPKPTVAFIPPSCCGAGYFRKLRKELGDRIDIHTFELPGHGRRYGERCVTDAKTAALDIAGKIGGPVDAVYGESLGAYIGLAVLDQLEAPPPLLLAASNSPPSVRDPIRVDTVDSIEVAVELLTAMGGQIPPEVLSDRDVAARAFPMMRADLYLSQSFIDLTAGLRVTADIRVLAGDDDTALRAMDEWANHTAGDCVVHRLPGGHLLSATNPAGVAAVLEQALL